MQKLPQIKAAYDWMIKEYDEQVKQATAAGSQAPIVRLESYRDSLERGVFVMLFGQFEREVTERFRSERESRKNNRDWRIRRGWDVPALGAKTVPFLTKLALLMDKEGRNFSKISAAYERRNHCAHGGTTDPVGSIDQFVEDLYVWQAELRRN